MKNTQLAKMSQIDLRDIWESEAGHFTPWLAKEENICLLGEALQLELEVEASEKDVGPFRADILCRDINSDRAVLIENQLETTDHVHLGQILTYAAGLKALTVIWIAKRFTEEHRATLDWLNAITDDTIHFFGVEMELWRIGDSSPAPRFNIVAKPNDWSSRVSKAASKVQFEDLSDTKKLQWEYWTALSDWLSNESELIRPQKALPQHWTNFAIGRSGMHLAATVNSRTKTIAVQLYMHTSEAKSQFKQLLSRKKEIEKQLGFDLEWLELPEKIASVIVYELEGADFNQKNDWKRQHAWLKSTLEKFHTVFKPIVRSLGDSDQEEAA
jgi:hypothetical protein